MSTVKKIIIGVLAVVLVFGAVAGGAVYFKKSHQETVPVVQVGSIASDYYTDDTMLEGNIVTNVTQNVNVDKDMIIQQVYVNEGDSVSKGDRLISFDMTLVQMELNIARLKKQQQEQDQHGHGRFSPASSPASLEASAASSARPSPSWRPRNRLTRISR